MKKNELWITSFHIAASIDGISGSPNTFASPNGAVKDVFSLNGCHSIKSINVKPKSPTPMLELAKLEHKVHTFQFFESMFTFNFFLIFKRPKWLCRNIINVPSICGLTKLDQSRSQNMALEVMPFMSVVSSKQVVNVEITNLHLVMSNGMFIHQAGKPTLSSLPGYLVEIHATSILVARMPCTPKSAQNMILYILSLVYNNKYTYNNLHILWCPNKKF